MTDTTLDIEAVKFGPVKCGHHFHQGCTSCRDAHEWNSATITALQARVVEAEGKRDEAREDVFRLARKSDEYRTQLTAAQAEVARLMQEGWSLSQHLAGTEDDLAEAEADLAAHKAAVAEAVPELVRGAYIDGATAVHRFLFDDPEESPDFAEDASDYAASIELPEPLRALAEPAKQPEGEALDVAFVDACREANEAGYQATIEQYAADLRKALAARGLSVGEG